MDELDSKKYCSKMPFFPKKLYLLCLFIAKGSAIQLFPIDKTFEKIEDSMSTVKVIVEECMKKDSRIVIPPQAIVVPLVFDSLVPLIREYWEGEHESYDFNDSTDKFLEFYANPLFYKYLITPGDYDEVSGRFTLNAAIPFTINSEEKELKNFMYHSNFPVHEIASHSAFYTPQKFLRYNYFTNKIDYPKLTQKKEALKEKKKN